MPEQAQYEHCFEAWLTYIESLHPSTMALGLDRLDGVARRLGLTPDLSDTARGGGFK